MATRPVTSAFQTASPQDAAEVTPASTLPTPYSPVCYQLAAGNATLPADYRMSPSIFGFQRASDAIAVNFELMGLSDERALDPQVIVPLLEKGAYDPNRAFIVNHLRTHHFSEFKRLLLESDAFFKNVSTYNPEWISVDLAAELLREKPALYAGLPARLKYRQDLAMAAVEKDGMMLGDIPQSMWTDELIKAAIRQNPHSIRFINRENAENYAEYRKMACELDGMAIAEIPEDQRTVELLEIALDEEPGAVVYLSHYISIEDVPRLKAMILQALSREPGLYRVLPEITPLLTEDPDIRRAALNDMDNYIQLITDSRTPRDVVATIIERVPRYYRDLPVDSPYRFDPAILKDAFRDEENIVDLMRKSPQTFYNAELLGVYEYLPSVFRKILALPHVKMTAKRIADLENYLTMIQDRGDLEARIASSPQNPQHPPKPVALLIYCKDDHNGAFLNNEIQTLMKQGYEIAYYEVKDEDELISVMQSYLPLLDSGDAVIIGGHGTQETLELSNTGEERVKLDTGDEEQLMDAFPAEAIHPGVSLILHSCSNADGGVRAKNVMNTMFRVFRGRWDVYAHSMPTDNVLVPVDGKVVMQGSFDGDVYHLRADGSYEIWDDLAGTSYGFAMPSGNQSN